MSSRLRSCQERSAGCSTCSSSKGSASCHHFCNIGVAEACIPSIGVEYNNQSFHRCAVSTCQQDVVLQCLGRFPCDQPPARMGLQCSAEYNHRCYQSMCYVIAKLRLSCLSNSRALRSSVHNVREGQAVYLLQGSHAPALLSHA